MRADGNYYSFVEANVLPLTEREFLNGNNIDAEISPNQLTGLHSNT